MAADRIRLTISVTPEVHAIFTRMSEAAGVSLGRCMGDWLTDTAEGAQFVAQKMADARSAPKTVMRELHAMAGGLQDQIAAKLEEVRKASRTEGTPPAGRGGAVGSVLPPSSNTGGKVPRENPRKSSGKST